ncbi:MAG TPA: hypothetical protein VGC68_06540, partial [Enterovirga sp.]
MSQAALRISDIEVASFRSSENLSASVTDGELGVVQGEFGASARPSLDQSGIRHSVAGAFDMIIRTGNLVRTAREESRQAVDEANQVIEKAGELVKNLEQRLEASEARRLEAEERALFVANRAAELLQKAEQEISTARQRAAETEERARLLLE